MVKKVITKLDSTKASGPDGTLGGSKELLAWTFIHTTQTFQELSEGVVFSRLLKGLSSGTHI